MEITGIIKKIYPLQQGTSKSTGQPWKSMEFLLETEDRYPQSACLLLMNDNCTRFNITLIPQHYYKYNFLST